MHLFPLCTSALRSGLRPWVDSLHLAKASLIKGCLHCFVFLLAGLLRSSRVLLISRSSTPVEQPANPRWMSKKNPAYLALFAASCRNTVSFYFLVTCCCGEVVTTVLSEGGTKRVLSLPWERGISELYLPFVTSQRDTIHPCVFLGAQF